MWRALGKGPSHPWPLVCRPGWRILPRLPPERRQPSCFGSGSQVFCLHRLSWQGISQCLHRGPGPGWRPVTSSVRPSWAEGRKKGLQLREAVALNVFLLDFLVCKEWWRLRRRCISDERVGEVGWVTGKADCVSYLPQVSTVSVYCHSLG